MLDYPRLNAESCQMADEHMTDQSSLQYLVRKEKIQAIMSDPMCFKVYMEPSEAL